MAEIFARPDPSFIHLGVECQANMISANEMMPGIGLVRVETGINGVEGDCVPRWNEGEDGRA